MTTFLWFIAILGLLEVGGALAYLLTGSIPQRTPEGVFVNAVSWVFIAAWAIYLI